MIKNAPTENQPSNDVRLSFYALYKQATIGNNTEPAPTRIFFTKRAKWEAWNNVTNMTQHDAKKAYIKLTNLFL